MPTHQISKYPRTHHIEGSRIQPGDENLSSVPFEQIAGRYLVVEEKMDGANAGIRFSEEGDLMLQSRGHYLTGGKREKHFSLFKGWAAAHSEALYEVLGSRYLMYGEWLYAKHTIYYNRLPHYFLEFDILDTQTNVFLSTPCRRALLKPLPFVKSVIVLFQGRMNQLNDLRLLLSPSCFITKNHIDELHNRVSQMGLDTQRVRRETDPSTTMEGIYIKVEENNGVQDRFKYVRPSFLTAVIQSETHWLNRPIISNRLAGDVDLFGAST
jgi:hypothetical protein